MQFLNNNSLFTISPYQLQFLFDVSNLRNSNSKKKLIQLGKTDAIIHKLRTNKQSGLKMDSPKQLQQRKVVYGINTPIIKQKKGLLKLIFQNFQDLTLQILLVATIISLCLGIYSYGWASGWLEGLSIFVAIFIIVSITSINNYIKQLQFEKLNKISVQKNVSVIRDNQKYNISVYQILVGDIIIIQAGEIIPADGIFIKGNYLVVNQSAVTGQSQQIRKQPENQVSIYSPLLLSGSKIIEGNGIMVALCIGINSCYGKIKQISLRQDDQETPLQQKLGETVIILSKIGFIFGILIFLVLSIGFVVQCNKTQNFKQCIISINSLNKLFDSITLGITILVVVIPQGLPLAVTITLAYSVNRMKNQNNFVRQLSACQIMGGANNICTDKTGTLTCNTLKVSKIYFEEKLFIFNTMFNKNSMNPQFYNIFLNSICQNTTAKPQFKNNIIVGNRVQCALLQIIDKLGQSYEKIRSEKNIIHRFDFNSTKKNMLTIYRDIDKDYIFCKGAPQFLIKNCTRYIDINGNIQKINTDYMKHLTQMINSFARQPLRIILLAYKPIKIISQIYDIQEYYQNDLIFLSLIGMKDPLKQGVTQAVNYCKQNGIRVRMVTGDNKQTAISIAKEAGILPYNYSPEINKGLVMQGQQFMNKVGLIQNYKKQNQIISDIHNFSEITQNLLVLARSSPQDKYTLITGLKQLGNIVAVTGDGTNDGPALKKADIGFAMGISGTQVAKDAAGIILLDDNFSSICTAIKTGRNIFNNIRKFMQYELTINLVVSLMVFCGSIFMNESPLSIIQMLWINLMQDTFASLALATQAPIQQQIQKYPYSRKEKIITTNMIMNIILQGLFQIIVLFLVLFKGGQIFDFPYPLIFSSNKWTVESGKHSTIFFNIFIYLNIWNYINCRRIKLIQYNPFKNIHKNLLFWFIFIISFIIQIIITELGGKVFKCTPLSIYEHLLCIGISFLCIPYGILCKIMISKTFDKIQCGNTYESKNINTEL